MRVLVCGGRDFGERSKAPLGSFQFIEDSRRIVAQRELLDRVLSEQCPTGHEIIIHGAARGADRQVDMWARKRRQKVMSFPADWYPNGRSAGMDRSAGPKRNQRMIDEGKPDLVVAFPGGKGTEDMKRRAKAAGIKVIEVPVAPQNPQS